MRVISIMKKSRSHFSITAAVTVLLLPSHKMPLISFQMIKKKRPSVFLPEKSLLINECLINEGHGPRKITHTVGGQEDTGLSPNGD